MPRSMQRRSQPAPSSEDPRAALRQALQAQAEADERVKFLEENLYRANSDHSDRYSEMVNASNHLLEAQRLNPIAMAEAYVNQGTSPPSPVLKAAQDAYNLAEKRFQDITQIEAAIIAEQDRSITAAMAAKVEVGKAIAQVLAPTLPHLLQAMNQAWTTLRSLRAVGDAIAHATAGQLPVDWLARYQETQPLQADRVGYPVNQDLISQWQSALAALVQDADTELPE